MSLSEEMIDAEVIKLQKCIVVGKVLESNIKKGDACTNEISYAVKGINGGYYLLRSGLPTGNCTIDSIFELGDIRKTVVGSKINFLIQNDINKLYGVISTNDIDIAKYPGLPTCEPNMVVDNSISFYYYIASGGIIFIGILFFILINKRNKNKSK